jgi:hypothetical protein
MMKVIEKMVELKAEGIQELWIQKENDFEYIYGLFGFSSIENPAYVEMNKEIFNSEVKSFSKITDKIARIIY